MPLASVERGVLQHARNKADLIWCIYGEEGSGRAPEVMQTHGFAEFGSDVGADNIVYAARR